MRREGRKEVRSPASADRNLVSGDSSQISDWTLKQGPAMEKQLRLMDLWPGAPWIQNQKVTCKSKCTKIK